MDYRTFYAFCLTCYVISGVIVCDKVNVSELTSGQTNETDVKPLITRSSSTLRSSALRQDKLVVSKTSNEIAESAKKTPEVNSTEAPPPETEESVAEIWRSYLSDTQRTMDELIAKAIPYLMSKSSGKSGPVISPSCMATLLRVGMGLRQMRSWAVKMLDSWGRPPAGLLRGSISDLGDYDECLDIVVKDDYNGDERFRGQYCSVHTKLKMPPKPDPFTLRTRFYHMENITDPQHVLHDTMKDLALMFRSETRLGVCLPSTCTIEDVSGIFTAALSNPVTSVSVSGCEVKRDDRIEAEQIVTLTIFVALLAIVLTSTILDMLSGESPAIPALRNYIQNQNGDTSNDWLTSETLDNFSPVFKHFSMYTNSKLLFDTRGAKMISLEAARFLSMGWLLLAHTYGLLEKDALANQMRVKSMLAEFPFQVITNCTLSVDTFFAVGGLLMTYTTLRSLQKTDGKLDFVRFILRRIFRILPPLLFTLGILFLMPLFRSGPLWNEVMGQELNKCRERWWTTAFLLTSWVPWEKMCLSHSWYLSVDFQLFLMTPVVLVMLYKKPLLGLLSAGANIVGGAIILAILTVVYQLGPTYVFVTPEEEQSNWIGDVTYYKPYGHVGPYFVGVLFGYVLYKYPKLTFTTVQRVVGWLLAMFLMFITLFGTFSWNNGHLPSIYISAISQATLRTGWSLGVAFMLYECVRGYGGPINMILSCKCFLPLGKISYTMYLYQFPVIWYRNSVKRQRMYLSHFEVVYDFLASFTATLLLSYFGHLIAEAPFLSLDKILFPGNRNKKIATEVISGNQGRDNLAVAIEDGSVAVSVNQSDKIDKAPVTFLAKV